MSEIVTERLVLRPPVAEDLPWMLENMNTPAVMRYLGGVVPAPEVFAARFAEDVAAFQRPEGHRRWTVWLNDGATRVGRVGLFRMRSPAAPEVLLGEPEVGWTFPEGSWGRGYATEAARGALGFAFGTLGLPLIYAQTSDSNVPSTRMMHRLGFARRAELDYVDPDYPEADNPTTVWSLQAPA